MCQIRKGGVTMVLSIYRYGLSGFCATLCLGSEPAAPGVTFLLQLALQSLAVDDTKRDILRSAASPRPLG